jgi:two-component sensor histidine kinase
VRGLADATGTADLTAAHQAADRATTASPVCRTGRVFRPRSRRATTPAFDPPPSVSESALPLLGGGAGSAAEQQVRLLMREMHHRGKNTLSLVQAIARQTATSGPEHFVERFTHRIQALATNQDLLVQTRWQGVDVDDLVRAQLAHFSDLMGYRISLNGPKLRLNGAAAQAIGMALHELATNAGKYGALSTDAGRVDVVWRVDSAIFKMAWTERQGPPVTPPDGRGFGSTVVEAMVKRAVNGEVLLEFDPAGVVWHLSCPAANALESQERGRNQEKQRSS